MIAANNERDKKATESMAQRTDRWATTMEDAVDVVQEAAIRVESNVTEGIQPDINEIRLYMSQVNDAANIRQKRLLWALYALIVLNLVTLLAVLIGKG